MVDRRRKKELVKGMDDCLQPLSFFRCIKRKRSKWGYYRWKIHQYILDYWLRDIDKEDWDPQTPKGINMY
jgi:hypothetical protein